MRTSHLLATALLSAAALPAQTNTPNTSMPRGITQVARRPSPVNTTGWGYFKVQAPTQRLFANPGKGLFATANVVYMTYFDMDQQTGFVPELNFRRSNDGGLTWEKAQILHRLSAGEQVGSAGAQILTNGHEVVVLFRTSALTPNGGVAVVGYSSTDQGQTWKGPVLLTPAFGGSNPKIIHSGGAPSGPEFRAVWTGDKIHLIYEGVYNVASAPVLEESFYCRSSLDAQGALQVELADVPMSNHASPNASDVDNVEIAGDGNLIVCLWQDQGSLSNDYNNTVIRISRDGGQTWQPQRWITKFDATTHPTHPSTDGNSAVAVSGASIVVITEDHRDQGSHGRYDEVWADVSLNTGISWQKTVLISHTAQLNDVDDNELAAMSGKFVINWFEDVGQGNTANRNMVVVATAPEIANGNLTPIDLSALGGKVDQQVCQNIAMNDAGRVIGISGETGGGLNGTSEASVLSWSVDGGLTWETSNGSEGERDVDDPWVAATLNGDFAQIYIEDFPPGGNNGNETIVSGVRLPRMLDRTSGNQGVEMVGGMQSAGGFAVMLISGQKPTQVNRIGIDGYMFVLNLDVFTNVGLSVPGLFVAAVDKQGQAKWPGMPNLSTLIGTDVWYLAVTIGGRGFVGYTDPVKF